MPRIESARYGLNSQSKVQTRFLDCIAAKRGLVKLSKREMEVRGADLAGYSAQSVSGKERTTARISSIWRGRKRCRHLVVSASESR